MFAIGVLVTRIFLLLYLTHIIQSLRPHGRSGILDPRFQGGSTLLRISNTCDFRCGSGECLDFKYVCDGLANCSDGSDETKDVCVGTPCPTFLFKCNYGACIEKSKVCNGEKDCADNSDEEPPVCARNPNICAVYEHRCNNGECISDIKVCDGKMDCGDDSDESEELCATIPCQNYLFRCAYGACVPLSARCDGQMDCIDGSDETGCYYTEEVRKRLRGRRHDCLLPDHPANGLYQSSVNGSLIKDGDQLIMTCNSNYSVWGSRSFQCDNGTWTPPLHESYCRRTCPALFPGPRHDIACFLNGLPRICEKPFESTTANVTCKDSFAPYGGSSSLICQSDGKWSDEPVSCVQIIFGSGCFLPPHLPNGRYELIHQKEYGENMYVPSWTVLRASCNSGYILSQFDYFICKKGEWLKLNESRCLRTCRSLYPTDSYNVRCEREGRVVSCERPTENTTVQLTCTPYYKIYHVSPILSCQNGEWDPPVTPCQPECGVKIVRAETLVIGGNLTVPGEYPWVVAIYRRGNVENRQVCSGTLISRFYVLSAAHCFANDAGEAANSSLFTLVAGKYYRDFNTNESGIQIRQIQRLFVHEDYKGPSHAYRDDIALIAVEPFTLSETVRIVCVDWNHVYEESDFQEGNLGVVVGWGLTQEASTPAETLKKLVVPYRSMNTCEKHLEKPFFKRFYVSDKICAGFSNQSMSVCKGDSGGGLFFPRKRDSIYFVRGIVSISPTSTSGCNSNHYSLYTKVSRYLQWIENKTRRKL